MRRHFDLLFRDLRRRSRESSEEHGTVLLQCGDSFGLQNHLFHVETAVTFKIDPVKPAVRRTDLILRPDSLFRQFLFDVNGIEREGMFTPHLFLQSVQAEQKTDGKSRACSQPCSRRQIRDVMNLDPFLDRRKL
jgi:hypothetical protein